MDFNMGEVHVQRFGITHLNNIKLELGFGKLRREDGKGEEKNADSRKQAQPWICSWLQIGSVYKEGTLMFQGPESPVGSLNKYSLSTNLGMDFVLSTREQNRWNLGQVCILVKGGRSQRSKQTTGSSHRLWKEKLGLTSECQEGTDYAKCW